MEKIKFKALTFDDVLLLPRYTDFMPSEAQLETKVSKNITLKIPLISAAMDTVTEAAMAIALAENGGIGIIHKNNSIEDQVLEVKTVKKYESGVVRDPTTIKSTKTINELMQLTTELSISGMPVVDDGKLMGIVTRRDFRYADNLSELVSSIMTPHKKLITVKEGFNQEEIKKLMYNNRIEKILVIDDLGALTGLVTMKDIDKSAEHPFATKDKRGSLQVGAALGTGADTLERATALSKAGVDLFVIDSAHGHSKNVIETIKLIKKELPGIDVMGGNVATPDGAQALIDAGVDSVKIGMGPGSICTTRIIAGIGVPQITAILSIKEKLASSSIPLIADGGVRFSGDISKALAAGADAVMLGGIFAGTEEAPGELELYQGRSFKTYRGMGSIGAMSRRNDLNRYSQDGTSNDKMVPEGVEGRVPFKGWVVNVIDQLIGGIKAKHGICWMQIYRRNALEYSIC
jgi:IMP dehydrogenase